MHFIPADSADAVAKVPPERREPLIGTYIGDFLVIGSLGKGGFGKVLLVLQRPLFKLRAACKVIQFEGMEPRAARAMLQKFENEAAALAVLQHPNIVRLLHYGRLGEDPYIVMEYVPGSRTLHREVQRLALAGEPMDHKTIRHVLGQVLNGLESAHEQQIIHRDIKPDNIMLQQVVGDPQHVKLVDFGLAKFVAERQETSMVLGTPMYMAPEQLTAQGIGPWSDLYAVGVIAFELLAGRRPFAGNTSQEIVRQKIDQGFDPVGRNAPAALAPQVAAFLRNALARRPADRYRTAVAFRHAMDMALTAPDAALLLSTDLTSLVDSEDLQRLRREEARLASERAALEAQRAALESERRELEDSKRRTPAPTATHALITGRTPIQRPPVRKAAWLWAAGAIAVACAGVGLAIARPWAKPTPSSPPAALTAEAPRRAAPRVESPEPSAKASPSKPEPVDRPAAVPSVSAPKPPPVAAAAKAPPVPDAVPVSPVTPTIPVARAEPVEAKPAASAIVKLTITTKPPGADVRLGDRFLCKTPCTASSSPGETLTVVRSGFLPAPVLVTHASDGRSVELVLKARPAAPPTTRPSTTIIRKIE